MLSKLPKLTRLDGRQITNEERQKHVGGVEIITKSLIRQYAKGTGALGAGTTLGGGGGGGGGGGVTTATATAATVTVAASPSREQTSGEVSGGVSGSGHRPDAPSSPTARPPVSPDSGSGTDNFVIPSSATAAAATTGAAATTASSSLSSSLSSSSSDEDPWWKTVESLDLNHRNLQKIENLFQLKNLRRLSLADNEISQVEGLESNTLLEELVLEENRIFKLEGIQTLTFLKKLDLGKNKVRTFFGGG